MLLYSLLYLIEWLFLPDQWLFLDDSPQDYVPTRFDAAGRQRLESDIVTFLGWMTSEMAMNFKSEKIIV